MQAKLKNSIGIMLIIFLFFNSLFMIPTHAAGFSDVTDSSKSYYRPVYWATEKGIITGYKDGTFRPNESCTRQQFVVMLWRMNGKPSVSSTVKFTDVKNNMSSYKAIQWAVSKNIIVGYKDGTFRPNNTLTRAQAVVMLWRMKGKPSAKQNIPFKDVSSTSSECRAIQWGVESGVVKGYSDNTFKPSNKCLRQHAATFLYRFDRNVLSKEKKLEEKEISTPQQTIKEIPIKYGNSGRLIIPNIGVNVAVNKCEYNVAQTVVDRWDSAALIRWYDGCCWVIADHHSQDFANLPNAYVGCTGYITNGTSTEYIRCFRIDWNGYNDGYTLWTGNGTDAELEYGSDVYMMYTCLQDWNHIFISYWTRN